MATILRAGGLRVIIFVDDHEPAHVHVFGDGHAKINLVSSTGEPELVWSAGMSRVERLRALSLVSEHRDLLLARWEEIHG
ncbi:DUF4160 domain-containing protein [Methylobacterium sp. J-077]|uniref:DUF4160 domain-containing protein n=1 Tax=Methylobacterium sp. J-077 TaxID=2836656 RepID=UPI001FBB1435|nr:DUF4160 domain-containing protein [Methylobacterium sp. J-077]MCJ2121309.1 DUF4160 domain-containing protein [Methylobacterium sp. J-077]